MSGAGTIPDVRPPVIAVAGMDFEAELARSAGAQAVFAARAALLERNFEAALGQGCSGILSFGTAGGLVSNLAPGDLVLASAVEGPAGYVATDEPWRTGLRAALLAGGITVHDGIVASVGEPLVDVAGKAALQARTGALVVDMESHLAAAWAARLGVPFAICRVVVDPAWRSLPRAALAGLRDDGTTVVLPVLRELLRAPAQLGGLLRVAGDARVARASLTRASEALARAGALRIDQAG